MAWGLWKEAPASGPAWGARAIWTGGEIDLLWDRQTMRKGAGEYRFAERVNAALDVARDKAREIYEEGGLSPDSEAVFTIAEREGLIIKGSCNASHGYLYLIAFDEVGSLSEAPADLKWSGSGPPPEIGTSVNTRMGRGTVLAYFKELEFVGVKLLLDDPPEWFTRQNGALCPACLFGAELTG